MGCEVLLETKGLTKRFGGLLAVSDVDFKLSKMELRAIIGPNGAGKSTFFNMIIGALKPTSGDIIFKGRNITALDKHTISKLGIATTLQLTSIFPGLTVFDNVWLAVQSRLNFLHPFKRREAMADLMDKVQGVLDLINLSHMAEDLAGNLSHGDQRLLEIGLALGTSPELLLLDEPTAGLSHSETIRTVETIKKLAKSTTIIIVEHDMPVIMGLAETISVLHEGRVIAQGTPQEIQEDVMVRSVYLGEPGAPII